MIIYDREGIPVVTRCTSEGGDNHLLSRVAAAKGARSQARQEEPKLDLARDRVWRPISGVEVGVVVGLQAARSADIVISQFRYLNKLLVHGVWSYQLILYSFYKSVTPYMTQFWISYESWTISFYNVIFTVLPPLVIGVFDQFVSARVMDRYRNCMRPEKTMCFHQGGVLVVDPERAVSFSDSAWVFGRLVLGRFEAVDGLGFGALVLRYSFVPHRVVDCARQGCVDIRLVDQVHRGGHSRLVCVHDRLSPALCPRLPRPRFLDRVRRLLWTDTVFYLTLPLVPAICLTRDLAWKYYKRTYDPRPYHVAQEVQKYNVLDYHRPRRAQFQKAIKKVRAVQWVKWNPGFAFSQTEGCAAGDAGGVWRLDQTGVIGAYRMAGVKPTGY
ncbi:hypothetical protein HD554DRAFT_2040341 [Boletus coccyginus]|nr:hypothetical protein HD554DRAFT_2040341 [Boletus coccyginus]